MIETDQQSDLAKSKSLPAPAAAPPTAPHLTEPHPATIADRSAPLSTTDAAASHVIPNPTAPVAPTPIDTGSDADKQLVKQSPDPDLDPDRKSKVGPTLAIVFAVAILALLIIGGLPKFFQRQALVNHTKIETAEAIPVSVVVAQPGAPVEEFTLPGATEAIQDAPIYSRVNGYLAKRYVNIGDHVVAGQVLADIDTPEVDQQVQAAISAVEQAKSNVAGARETLKRSLAAVQSAAANVRKGKTDLQFYTAEVARYTELASEGAISLESRDAKTQDYNGGTATLDSLRNQERGAKAQAESNRAAVAMNESALKVAQAQLSQVQATQSFKQVRALFDGVVTKRNVDAGALITAGSADSNSVLFEIAKTDILRLFVYVPEQYVPYIHEGQTTLLSFQEYPKKDFSGTVTNISGGLDPATKTLQVEIHVPNGDHQLLPGMYAKVRFQATSTLRLPIVPATILQTKADGSFAFTIDDKNRVHMHKLDIGRDLGGIFEISNGIVAGQKVIVNPPDNLVEGELVAPQVVPIAKPTGQ
ncbi:MAG: efflux RND transporter periplasmic adaptor subunit [Cyanobacteria bacterium REEB67]|nr:efflux RND transporter periplasmic adaptor subunit [Cyanobacteria bacterium REEB67]